MKKQIFEPPIPKQRDISDFHCVKIHLHKAIPKITIKCSICNREMKRIDYNLFVCDPNTRSVPKKEYSHYHHYKPEPIDLIEKYQLNFSEGCFVKYMLRCEFKGDKLGDLKKALYYLKRCKETSFPRKIKYYEIYDYYTSKKFSREHLSCILSFITGERFGYIKEFLEYEISSMEHNHGS